MDYGIYAGDTSKTIYFRLRDSTTGLAKTGLTFESAGASCYYTLPLAVDVQIPLVTLAAPTTAWASGGFIEVDAVTSKGLYRLDLSNAAIASGDFTIISIEFDGVIEESQNIPLHVRSVNLIQINGALTDGSPAVADRPILHLQQLRAECDIAGQAAFLAENANVTGIGALYIGGDVGVQFFGNDAADILLAGTGTIVDASGNPVPVNTTEFAGTAVPNTSGKLHVLDGDGNAIASDVKIDRNADLGESRRGHHTWQGNYFYVDPVNGDTHANGNRGGRSDPYLTIQDCHDNAVIDSNHDVIFLVAGAAAGVTTHTVAATTTISKRYTLIRGPGRDFIITRTGNGPTFAVTASGVEFSGFQLESPGESATSFGILITAVDFVSVRNCWILDTQGDGIHIQRGSNCQIFDNKFDGTGIAASGQAIHISGAGGAGNADENMIQNNIIANCVGDAILIDDGTTDSTTIRGNSIRGSGGWGIVLTASSDKTHIYENRLASNVSGNIDDGGTNTTLQDNVALDPFDLGAVWIDTVNGSSGTEYPIGTSQEKSDNIAETKTIADAHNYAIIEASPGSALVFEDTMTGYKIRGNNYTLDFSGETSESLVVEGATLSGTLVSSGSIGLLQCRVTDATSLPSCGMGDCNLTGDIVLTGTFYNMKKCGSVDSPSISLENVAAQTVFAYDYDGNLEVKSMNAGDSLEQTGAGHLTINADCTGGTITLRGFVSYTDNVAGGFVAGGGVINDETRFELSQVMAQPKTYYVETAANGGSDSNSGVLPADPFLTPEHAIETAASEGDEINIGPGTFGGHSLDNGPARDAGGGLVGIPITGHTFTVGDVVTISGTTNYDGTEVIHGDTSANEIVITDTFVAETLGATVIGRTVSITDEGNAVNKGDGTVGIPAIGHGFAVGDLVSITHTTHYGGSHILEAATSVNELVITADFEAEEFDEDAVVKPTARDAGDGMVGLPIVGHKFAAGDIVNIDGSTSYDGTQLIDSETTDEIVITADYVAQEFGGSATVSETAVTREQLIPKNGQRIVGVGSGATVIQGNVSNQGVVLISGKSGISISHTYIQNVRATGIGIKLSSSDDIVIDHCRVNGPKDGIRCDDTRVTVTNTEAISLYDAIAANGSSVRVTDSVLISSGEGVEGAEAGAFRTGLGSTPTNNTTSAVLERVTLRVDRKTARTEFASAVRVDAFATATLIDCPMRAEATSGDNTGEIRGIVTEDSASVSVAGGSIRTINAGSLDDGVDAVQSGSSALLIDDWCDYDPTKVSGTITRPVLTHGDANWATADVSALPTADKLLAYVQLITRSDAFIATDRLTELNEINTDEGSGAGGYVSTTDSQQAIRDRGDTAWTTGTGGSGSGARTVTVTVDDGTTVLENATVRFTEGVNTFTGLTNASGVIVFSLDDATYAVSISKTGYSFTPTTKIVNGTEADTYSMDIVAITPPPNAATTTGVMLVYDEEGALEEGVTVTVQIIDGPGTDGIGYDSTEWAELSSALGLVEFAGIILGGRYKIWRGTSKSKAEKFTAPTTGTSFDLAEVIGRG